MLGPPTHTKDFWIFSMPPERNDDRQNNMMDKWKRAIRATETDHGVRLIRQRRMYNFRAVHGGAEVTATADGEKSRTKQQKKECPSGKELNTSTGRCRKRCRDEQVRNFATGRCVKSKRVPVELTDKDVVTLASYSFTIPQDILSTLCQYVVATISKVPGLSTLVRFTPGRVKRTMAWVVRHRRILALAAQLYKYLKFCVCLLALGPGLGLDLLKRYVTETIKPLSIWGKRALEITTCIFDLVVSGATLSPVQFSEAILKCLKIQSDLVFGGLLGK